MTLTGFSWLERIWLQQVTYNRTIRSQEEESSYEYWMKQYLLGAVSEVDEILAEINWKAHRRGHPTSRNNLARELADLTKYVLCMWEWSGFSVEDVLEFVEQKGLELDQQLIQDFAAELSVDTPIILTDVDGTLGDWRGAFREWVQHKHGITTQPDSAKSMAIEINLGLDYPTYARYKEEFEAEGGYGMLEPYGDAIVALREIQKQHKVHVIAYTARPARVHTRIWNDTWQWLVQHKLQVAELRIGHENRISRACELQAKGHKVVLWEDDPSLALRAANTGIQVVMRAQPYNLGITHPNIWKVMQFSLACSPALLVQDTKNGKA